MSCGRFFSNRQKQKRTFIASQTVLTNKNECVVITYRFFLFRFSILGIFLHNQTFFLFFALRCYSNFNSSCLFMFFSANLYFFQVSILFWCLIFVLRWSKKWIEITSIKKCIVNKRGKNWVHSIENDSNQTNKKEPFWVSEICSN